MQFCTQFCPYFFMFLYFFKATERIHKYVSIIKIAVSGYTKTYIINPTTENVVITTIMLNPNTNPYMLINAIFIILKYHFLLKKTADKVANNITIVVVINNGKKLISFFKKERKVFPI